MSKTVPTSLTPPDLSKFQAGQDISAADWNTLNEALNYHYSRLGSHLPGMVFDPAPWQTNSTSYTSTNSSATDYYDLDDWNGYFRFVRPMYSTGDDQYSIRLDAYAQNLDVRATLTRIDVDGGTTGSSTAFTGLVASTTSGDSEWISDDLVFTTAQQATGGAGTFPAWFIVYVEAKVPSAGTGYLWTFSLRETVLTGSELPRT